MVVDRILDLVVPGRAARKARDTEDKRLDKELKDTFPSSDPLASVQPGSGVTGAEVKPSAPSPSQLAKKRGAAAEEKAPAEPEADTLPPKKKRMPTRKSEARASQAS